MEFCAPTRIDNNNFALWNTLHKSIAQIMKNIFLQ
jgi:hypothetical protein